MAKYNLLTEANQKVRKGEKIGFYSLILHLSPSTRSGHQVCPMASPGCIATCLNTAGRGGMFRAGETTNTVQEARLRRTHILFGKRDEFMNLLVADIEHGIKRAHKLGLTPVIRLNGTSDLPFEKFRVGDFRNIMERFPLIQFYDYTKIAQRMVMKQPSNYHLTFSASELNHDDCHQLINQGHNVAVVVTKELKSQLLAKSNVIDGDETDLRFMDGYGKLILLTAKGKAKKDVTGFVLRQSVDFV